MQEVQVDTIDSKPAETLLACLNCSASRRIVGIDLADQKDLVTPPANRLSDQFLGSSLAVHFRSIDERHPQFDSALQRRDFLRTPPRAVADVPRPQTKSRNLT